MVRRLCHLMWVAGIVASLAGCSKGSLPKAMEAVPADADVIATVDSKAVLDYAKQAVPKLVPPEMKDKIPTFEQLAQQAAQLVGIDLNKLGRVTFIGYLGSNDKMAIVAEGIDAKALKGEKRGDHAGVALYAMPEKVFYAELAGAGVVVGPSEEMLKTVLDAYSGKAKRIADTDRAALLKDLTAMETGLDQVRVYLLSGKLPMGDAGFTMNGGGFFLHLDRGLAGAVVSDQKGADDLKQKLDFGMIGLKAAMAAGTDLGPMKLDAEAKKLLGDVLGKLQTSQKEKMVSVSYTGDLKPIIEKAVAFGIDMAKAEAAVAEAAAKEAAAAAADQPAPEAAAPKADEAKPAAKLPPAKKAKAGKLKVLGAKKKKGK